MLVYSFNFECRSFSPLPRPSSTTMNDLSPVVVSRRYLSICGKVISGRSSAAPYRSKNEQTSAKLGQSAGPELLITIGAAIFPGGENQEGRARSEDATVYEWNEWREWSIYRCQVRQFKTAQFPGMVYKIKRPRSCFVRLFFPTSNPTQSCSIIWVISYNEGIPSRHHCRFCDVIAKRVVVR